MGIVSTANSEHDVWGDGCDGWHLLEDPCCHVIREKGLPGKSERRHFHSTAQQFFFILEGIHSPAGRPHRFMNPFRQPVAFLVISNPTTRGDRANLA